MVVCAVIILLVSAGLGVFYLQTEAQQSQFGSQVASMNAKLDNLSSQLNALNQEYSNLTKQASVLAALGQNQYVMATLLANAQGQIKNLTSTLNALRDQIAIASACGGETSVNLNWNKIVFRTNETDLHLTLPVLEMHQASQASFCVTYEASWNSSLSSWEEFRSNYFQNPTVSLAFYADVCQRLGPGSIECLPTADVTGTVLPSQINITRYTKSFTVVFTIQTPASLTGFYEVGGNQGGGLLLSVGSDPANVTTGDFVISPGGSTHTGPFSVVSLSAVGANLTYLEFTCPVQLAICN